MPDQIKGIAIKIGGDTTGLRDALKGVNADIKSTQSQLKDVQKLLKLDPTNVTLLEQRQRLLNQAIQETKQKLTTLREAERQAQEQLKDKKISQEQYEALQREIIATENQLKSFEDQANKAAIEVSHLGDTSNAASRKIAEVDNSAEQAAKELEEMRAANQRAVDSLSDWASKTKTASTAAAGLLGSLAAAGYSAITASDDLNTLSKQTGFTTADLQKMQYAADRIDVSMEDITSSAAKLKRNMTSTSSGVTAAWNRLGVSVTDANGQLRDSTTVFWETVEALSGIESETERDTVAMALFGKSADSLAGVVDDGGKALRDYGTQAERLGLILDQETLDSLNSVNDEIDTLKANVKATIALNGAKAVEAATPLLNELFEILGEGVEKLSELDAGQIKSIATMGAIVAAASPVLSIASKVISAVGSLSSALPGLWGLLAANPMVGAGVAATGLVAALVLANNAFTDSTDRVTELTAAAKNYESAVNDGKTAVDKTVASEQARYEQARRLIKRMEELETQTELTAAEQWEYRDCVDQLNTLYPELNAQIDENTGKLDGNINALYGQVAAMRTLAIQQAMQEYYNEILAAQAQAQIEVYRNQAELRRITDEYNAAAAEEARLQQAYNEALAATQVTAGKTTEQINEEITAMRELETAHAMAEAQATALADEMDKLNEAIAKGEAVVQEYAEQYDQALSWLPSHMGGTGQEAGEQFANGLIRGLQSRKQSVINAAENVASEVNRASRRTLEINSPSRVAEDIGKYWDLGEARGLERNRRYILDALDDVNSIMANSSITNNAVDNSVHNHSNTTTLSGVNVTVNAAPGQDAHDLALQIMDEIQAEVERERAAL